MSLLLAMCVTPACRGEQGSAQGGHAEAPPAAEFLLAAGDSTYWVRSDSGSVHVRSAPVLLTRVGEVMYEIFVASDGVEYADASFSAATVWARPLLSQDSVLLYQDSTVWKQAALWKRRHPLAEPLSEEDENDAEEPVTVVRNDIDIVDVHGAFLSVTISLDVDLETGASHQHASRRAVLDVRDGHVASLGELFAGAAPTENAIVPVLAAARAAYASLTDSLRSLGDERATRASEALRTMRFDSTSFAVTDSGRAPAVAFMITGHDDDGGVLNLYLPPIAVAIPAWWDAVSPGLPRWSADSSAASWDASHYSVSVHESTDNADMLMLEIGAHSTPASAWLIGQVASPVYQLLPIDAKPVDDSLRSALARAFDRSMLVEGGVQRASNTRAAHMRARRIRLRLA